MAGIYIHIPFCKKACHYCNFHFSTNLKEVDKMVNAIIKEIDFRFSYLREQSLDSIYFGGGTPSILDQKHFDLLFGKIGEKFTIKPSAEITLEANPDDLTPSKLEILKNSMVNRLSIGIQSFDSEDLEWMNRSHTSDQAYQCIVEAKKYGFDQLNIDLIFGGLTTTMDKWKSNLEIAAKFDLPHISCYGLTIEERTALHSFIKKEKMSPPDEEIAVEQYLYLMEFSDRMGWEHYEISNFCKNGHRAVHNTSYWQGKPYAGFGPSAHSFNGISRQWNISNNAGYIKILEASHSLEDLDNTLFQLESLSPKDQYNESIMLGLRQKAGIEKKIFQPQFYKQLDSWVHKGHLIEENGKIFLSTQGKLIADQVISDLFI